MSSDVLFGIWHKTPSKDINEYIDELGVIKSVKALFQDACQSQYKINIYDLVKDNLENFLLDKRIAFDHIRDDNYEKYRPLKQLSFKFSWNTDLFWGKVHIVTIPAKHLYFLTIPVQAECDDSYSFAEFWHRYRWIEFDINSKWKHIFFTDDSNFTFDEILKNIFANSTEKIVLRQSSMIYFSYLYDHDLKNDNEEEIHHLFSRFGPNLAQGLSNSDRSFKGSISSRIEDNEDEDIYHDCIFTKNGAAYITKFKQNLCEQLDSDYWMMLIAIIQKFLLSPISDKIDMDYINRRTTHKSLKRNYKALSEIRIIFPLSGIFDNYIANNTLELFSQGFCIEKTYHELDEKIKLVDGIIAQDNSERLQNINLFLAVIMMFYAIIPVINNTFCLERWYCILCELALTLAIAFFVIHFNDIKNFIKKSDFGK